MRVKVVNIEKLSHHSALTFLRAWWQRRLSANFQSDAAISISAISQWHRLQQHYDVIEAFVVQRHAVDWQKSIANMENRSPDAHIKMMCNKQRIVENVDQVSRTGCESIRRHRTKIHWHCTVSMAVVSPAAWIFMIMTSMTWRWGCQRTYLNWYLK